MLTKNLTESNHALFVIVYCASNLMQCRIWNATLVTIDSIVLVCTSGLAHLVKTNVHYASSLGVELKLGPKLAN